MWSQIVLCLFVGLAFASNSPAWKDNTEYVYQVRGRTLASLHEVSNDYTGVFLKAKLIVRPRPDGVLDAKIVEPHYAPVHTKLAEGWETIIPDSQLSYKQLPISQKPFQIVLKNGAVRDLIVNKEIPNWEANIIKSIVSQLQLDTQAENLIPSHINVLPQEDSNTAVFKTMEETVTGVAETLYDIHYLPEYVLQTKPWMMPKPELRGNGKIYEVVKNKNYTRAEERPAYHFGFEAMDDFEPIENQMGRFFTRNTITRAVITGTLQRYTVQSSLTVDEIIISPTLNDKQKGSVRTMLNVTLLSFGESNQQFEPLSNGVNLGSLVYRFDKPYSTNNQVRPGQQFNHEITTGSAESEGLTNDVYQRNKRSIAENLNMKSGFNYDISSEEHYWEQEQPKLSEAPESPLLPFTVGFEGQSLKKKQNINDNVRKLVQEIAQEMDQPEQVAKQNTVGKFVILTSLLRIMNQNEMQQVASQLYTKEQEGTPSYVWAIFRDAVAQSGTGPALMCIQEWIKTDKISRYEAAEVVSTAAYAARQPTEEYMKMWFSMIKDQHVMEQRYLNESTLLAFTKLTHEVYVSKQHSHGKYPIHSFGTFCTKSGKEFLKTEVIPYLTEQLHHAIVSAQTEKIHTWIRALGNVGHQRILEAFEPYLEGKKQCSQFQRVLMVVALDKLVMAYPTVARSVLYKIYSNPTEYEQVRVAAVYQLMRTSPPADMLQRMATYTNTDSSEYVNSAVQSVIRSAAELRNYKYVELRNAAQSAMPLLTKHQYGAQYSKGYLRSYVVDEIKTVYKQSVHTYGSEESMLPKGIQYVLRGDFAGLNRRLVNMHALISNVDDLVNVLQHQTERFQQHENSQRSEQQQWSVENIAKLLNMQGEQREQLEGNLHLDMASFEKLISFDNHTIEMLPQYLREIEQSLMNGKHIHHTKMLIGQELALAFPTHMGLPFIYTYDKPTLVRLEGKIRATAQPQIANGNKLRIPENVEAEYEVRALFSGKAQSQLAFITPFDNQRYSAGYEKNFQVYVPLSGKIHLDMVKSQLKTEMQILEQNPQMLQFNSWPYTSQDDIFTTEPKRNIIRQEHPQKLQTVFGVKSTGIAMQLEATLDKELSVSSVYEKLRRHDLVSALLSPWIDENIQHCEIVLRVDSGKSTTQKIVAQLGFQQKYQARRQEDNTESADISKFDQISEEPLARQNEFMRRAIADINNAHARIYDAQVQFQGQQEIKYIATFASGKSNVDPKGRLLVQLKRTGGQVKPLRFYLSAKIHAPNTNGLDLAYAMKFDPTVTSQVQAAFGQTYESATKIKAQIQFRKSEERKQYLMELPEYHECQREMQQGNKQLHACAKMTAIANLLDHFTIKVDYQNMDNQILNQVYKCYTLLRHIWYPSVEEQLVSTQGTGKDNLEIQGHFDRHLDQLNFVIRSKQSESHIKNIYVNRWAQQLLVPHPVFHVKSRLMGYTYNYDVYRPFCVVDKQSAKTFDNKTYPVELTQDWTVLLQYVPRRAPQHHQQQVSVHQQLKEQIENYAVLVRAAQGNQKEVKIVVQTPETQGKLVEINFKQTGSQPKVFVNGEEVKFNTQEGSDIFNGFLQVYGLPNNEVKVELIKAFYVIYDGARVKLTIVDNKFRDATRGLCGTFDGEQHTDFLSAKNCILRKPEEFVASYTIWEQGKQQNQHIVELKERADKEHCYTKQIMYANVISGIDTGRMGSNIEYKSLSRGSCTRLQTQYVVEGDEICFTLKPLPVCKPGCQRRGNITKNIAVHCVQSTSATDLWKNEIEKGASPDFSLKSQSRTVRMEIAQACSA